VFEADEYQGLAQREAVRRSQMRGFVERGTLRLIGMRAYRCESCDQRHYNFRDEYEFKNIESKNKQ
jgi:hypothetical protein